jgi:hypothetical protein
VQTFIEVGFVQIENNFLRNTHTYGHTHTHSHTYLNQTDRAWFPHREAQETPWEEDTVADDEEGLCVGVCMCVCVYDALVRER